MTTNYHKLPSNVIDGAVDGGGDGSRAGRFGRVSFSVLPVFVRFSVLLHPFLRYSVLPTLNIITIINNNVIKLIIIIH